MVAASVRLAPPLTPSHVHDKRSLMGRKKTYTEQIRVPLPEGKTAEIDSVLEPGEYRLDLMRDAIDREVARRVRRKRRLSDQDGGE